jgi:hypothetical protein
MAYEYAAQELLDDPGKPRFGGPHVVAAIVAAALSLSFHGGAVYLVSQVRIEPTQVARTSPATRRKFPPFRLDEAAPVDRVTQDRVLDALRAETRNSDVPLPRVVETVAATPDEAAMEPPALTDGDILGGNTALAPADAIPERSVWQPRQAILAIEEHAIGDAIAPPERRVVSTAQRVARAPDVPLPLTDELLLQLTPPAGLVSGAGVAPPRAAIAASAAADDVPPPAAVVPEPIIEAVAPGGQAELFEETREDVTSVKPIERMLTARVATYTSMRDFRYGYFRIEVERVGEEALPVLPKDILLVQDCSASMAEQRLQFCRQALRQCLDRIGPADRFNIVSFKAQTTFCFADWQSPNATTLTNAVRFIDGMQAGGNTDIYAAMKDLLSVKRERGRPVVALVVTDGLANTGLTDNSDIIGSFTKVNDGRISVFAMGTVTGANEYLLDLLTYSNRGASLVVSGGRWAIPEALTGIMDSVRRPVLGNVQLRFAQDTECEVYPVQTSNLYLDRPLVLYGRYRKGMESIVFQAIGEAGAASCDMVFNLPLEGEGVVGGERDIREMWARQKIYHLIARYTRSFNKAVLDELRATARAYKQDIPYRNKLF